MILNSGYLDKNSQQNRIIFLDREFDLVLDDGIRPTSREVGRMQVCIVDTLTKIVSFHPNERLFYKIVPILTVDYTRTWIRIFGIS
jgi:hypothetical protein